MPCRYRPSLAGDRCFRARESPLQATVERLGIGEGLGGFGYADVDVEAVGGGEDEGGGWFGGEAGDLGVWMLIMLGACVGVVGEGYRPVMLAS